MPEELEQEEPDFSFFVPRWLFKTEQEFVNHWDEIVYVSQQETRSSDYFSVRIMRNAPLKFIVTPKGIVHVRTRRLYDGHDKLDMEWHRYLLNEIECSASPLSTNLSRMRCFILFSQCVEKVALELEERLRRVYSVFSPRRPPDFSGESLEDALLLAWQSLAPFLDAREKLLPRLQSFQEVAERKLVIEAVWEAFAEVVPFMVAERL